MDNAENIRPIEPEVPAGQTGEPASNAPVKTDGDAAAESDGIREVVELVADSVEQRLMAKYISGPIPSAEEFEKYEQVLSGTANRLLTLHEEVTRSQISQLDQEQKNRHERDMAVLSLGKKTAYFGLAIIGLTLILVAVAVFHEVPAEYISLILAVPFGTAILAMGYKILTLVMGKKTKDKDDSSGDE